MSVECIERECVCVCLGWPLLMSNVIILELSIYNECYC